MARQPAAVSFVQLDANPALYRNNLVRVTGEFMPLDDPPCDSFKGPDVDWALIDQDLRLDVQGFEHVMQLVSEGTQVTVDGFWQLYEGPVGCDKEPPRQTLWYLRAVQLVQPNPLPQLAALPQPEDQEDDPSTTPSTGETPTPTIDATASATPTSEFTPTPSLTPDMTASPSPTPEPVETPTPESEATPSPTPEGDEEETPESEATPSPTPEGEEGDTPVPGPTDTPSGYPGATATTDPYP